MVPLKGILFHSCTNACSSSRRFCTGGSLSLTFRPSWSQRCSIGLRSGLLAGHGRVFTALLFKKSTTIRARWSLALSSMKICDYQNAALQQPRGCCLGNAVHLEFLELQGCPAYSRRKCIPTSLQSPLQGTVGRMFC